MRSLINVLFATTLLGACTEANDPAPDAGDHPDAGSQRGDAHVDEPDAHVGNEICALPAVSGSCEAYIPRWFHNAETGQCEMFIYGGCDGNANNFETLAACEQACVAGDMPEPCEIDATDDSLPGVTIHVESPRCNFEVGQPGEFSWQVTVAQPIAYQVEASMGCGSCRAWGSNSPGQFITYRIGGDGPHYCECDVGCCAPDMSMAYTLPASSAVGTIQWPGKQWNGPSDTNNEPGEPFPAGAYDVEVSLALPGAGTVTAKLPIKVE